MTTFSRRSVLTYAGAGALSLSGTPLLVAPVLAQEQDVDGLLQESAAAMGALESFKFELETVNGTSTILDNLELKQVTGSVKRPDSFTAAVTAGLAVVDLTVQVVGIGQRLWVTDPLDDGGRFVELALGDDASGAGSLAALINPDRVFLTAVGLVENAVIDGTEKIDGVETTVVTGEFDASKLVTIAGTPTAGEGGSLEDSGFPAELILDRMPVTIWIDDAKRVVRLEIEGQLTSSESADVIRGIDFYDFDEPVEIPEPTNVAPAT